MKLGKGDVEDGKKWWRGLYYSAFFQENLFLIIFLLSPFNMRMMMMMMMEAEINWLALACSLRTTLSPVFFFIPSPSMCVYISLLCLPHCMWEHVGLQVYGNRTLLTAVTVITENITALQFICSATVYMFYLRCSDLVVVLCRLLSRRGHCHVIHDDFASSAGQQLYLFVNLWKLPFQVILYPPYPCFLLFNLQMPLCVC